MKKLYTSLALALLAISTFAQTANISMTTTLSINSQITIGLSGNASSTPIQIDWGNGVKENFTIGDTEEFFGYPVKGSNIKIWGTGITGLSIQSKSITVLDFFEATNLKWLFCKNNQITTLNLTGCSALTFVECKQNSLNSLTLPSTTTLTYVDCSDNNLTLATLPIKQSTWTDYIYSPQKDYALPKTVYAVNEEIDLSSQLSINGNTTTFTWKTAGGATLVNGVDYSVTGGKFTFLKTYSESIYCEMANTTFPSLTIKTKSITVLTLPSIEMSTSNTIESSFSFIIRSDVNNSTAFVDWGDGTLTTHNVFTSNSYISGTLKGGTIKVYGEGIVYIDVTSNNLSTIDISNCTSLKYLFCNDNQLTSIDVSKNTSLINLNCSYNKLTSLDVSKNILLWNLDCDNNTLSSLDVTKNTALTRLDCGRAALSNLDITKNLALTELYCAANNLTQLDVSKNTSLSIINCYENKLSSLVLNGIPTITEVRCYSNKLDFSTLPLKQPSWSVYSYNPQAQLGLPKKNYALNEEIDLSSQLAINSITTNYKWKTKGGIILTAGTDYTENNGKFSFINTIPDSIYCEMTNATFPNLTLSSTAIELPQEPILTMTTTTPIGSNFNFIIRSSEDYTPVKVNWGDGTITSHNVITGNSTISGTIKGNTIKVYGSKIIYIDVISKNLTSIDITNNTPLKYLFCYENQLTSIDVSKNTSLLNLNCSYNKLTSLDVSKNILLWNLDCDNNPIANLDVTNNTVLTRLDCGRTSLSSLDITKNIALTELYCAANSLTQLDVSKNSSLSIINCYENKLSSLALNNISTITEVRCYSNNFTFSSLPIKQPNWTIYTYYPQGKIILTKKQYGLSETVDLSSQLTANGNTTNYIWKTKGGTTLTSGTDYTIIGGITTFLKDQTDSVYCQMTNATFPLLTLSTTNIKVSDPTSIESDFKQITKVYPNPVSNLLWVASEEIIKRIEIYTVVGTRVFEQDYNSYQKVNINTANFPKGLLIVKVYGLNGVMEKKILKE